MKAIGMIEVYGYLTAVEALDSAVKAAEVSLVEVTKVTGGFVSVILSGDVAAIKAAVDVAAASADRVGQVLAVHVIARPAPDIDKITGVTKGAVSEKRQPDKKERNQSDNKNQLTEEEMEKMTVGYLRSLAREIGVLSMTKQEIRYARKKELISAILNHWKGVK